MSAIDQLLEQLMQSAAGSARMGIMRNHQTFFSLQISPAGFYGRALTAS